MNSGLVPFHEAEQDSGAPGFYSRRVAMSSDRDDWTTPLDLFQKLDREFHFVLDAAALKCSALCEDWYGPDQDDPCRRDALTRSWTPLTQGSVWLNPPYGRTIGDWMKKASEESAESLVVCLVPARTDTAWWHNYCIDREVRFLRGRLKFGGHQNPAPFPSAVVIMRPDTAPEITGQLSLSESS